LAQQSSTDKALWSGRPWILPGVVWRTIQTAVVAVLLLAIEIFTNTADTEAFGLPLVYWTLLVIAVVWILSLANLMLLRASHRYVLREDSLEIRSGILTSRTSVISPSGFSDLEVIQSIVGRIIGSGNIVIRTQSETRSERRRVRVRHPGKVADAIRGVMSRPLVRVERGPDDKKV
jgi:uncharacterized membrane protein YdbT with pleckstrin-like domain